MTPACDPKQEKYEKVKILNFWKISKISIFSKNDEKLNFEQMGSFFEWFWTCGQKIFVWKCWKISKNLENLEKVMFSLKTDLIWWFCVFYLIERKKLISAISRKKSNLNFSIIFSQKYVFFIHFGVFSKADSPSNRWKYCFFPCCYQACA